MADNQENPDHEARSETPADPQPKPTSIPEENTDHDPPPKARLIILLNILGAVIILCLSIFVVGWPSANTNNVQEVERKVNQGLNQEAWVTEAEYRAQEADTAAGNLRVVTLCYYIIGVLLFILLLINAWYLFTFARHLGRANRRLAEFKQSSLTGT
jgi:hypothetical protein